MSRNIYHDVPIFIICRDRLAPLRQLVEWLEQAGHTNIVLVDNASTYPPLLEFLEECPHHLVSLPENVGHLAVWVKGLQTQFTSKTLPGFYIVSDCDVVPDEHCPPDIIERLYSILRERPNMDKAGLGLKIDDLPDCFQFKRDVIDWESQFWEAVLEPGVYDAPIDTTFALYRPGTGHSIFRSMRTGSPYVARHLPWYQNSAALNAEELYYREHMNKNIGSWGGETLPYHLAHSIEERRNRYGAEMRQAFANGYGTHIPLLAAVLAVARKGPVLELGSGWSSTLLLNEMCKASGRKLRTIDSDMNWLSQFEKLKSQDHELVHAPDWDVAVADTLGTEWSVIFIDHAPAERRIVDIEKLANKAEFIVIHDTEDPTYNYGPTLAKFKYAFEYRQMSPYTSVFSNVRPYPADR